MGNAAIMGAKISYAAMLTIAVAAAAKAHPALPVRAKLS